jgi:dTDP-glucose pyrophosphorylase
MQLLPWQQLAVRETDTIETTLRVIDQGTLKIALLVDAQGVLLGTISDGDIRRALLRGAALQSPIAKVANRNPKYLTAGTPRRQAQLYLQQQALHLAPVLDAQLCVLGVVTPESVLQAEPRTNWVVLMAGGMGTRLRPYTENTPKPLLQVGGRPILETILLAFRAHGFQHFYISLNYLGEQIEQYFGDGSRWQVNIRYVYEKERLGTGGALSLLPNAPTEPFFLMNGDLLTRPDFSEMLDYHLAQQAAATMAVREYEFQVPYGVVNTDNQRITGMVEKPVQHFYVNAGIYVLSPHLLAHLPKGEFYDITTLLEKRVESGERTMAFPLHDFWMDIGQPADYQRAQTEYPKYFEDLK